MISSSRSAEANCIQDIESVIADPRLLPFPNWTGHRTTLEPGRQSRKLT